MLEIWTTETGDKAHVGKPGTDETLCGTKITHGRDIIMEVPNLHHVAQVCDGCARAVSGD